MLVFRAQLKKFKESVADCTAALELDENYQKALLRRAQSNMELEEYDDAVRDYEKAHRIDRSDQDILRCVCATQLVV